MNAWLKVHIVRKIELDDTALVFTFQMRSNSNYLYKMVVLVTDTGCRKIIAPGYFSRANQPGGLFK